MLFGRDRFALLDALTYGGLLAFLAFAFQFGAQYGLLLFHLMGLSFLMGHKTAYILARRAREARERRDR